MASSERATFRSLAVPSSTAGRLVLRVRPGSCWALASASRRLVTFAATAVSWLAGMLAVCGTASQVPWLTTSDPAKAPAGTASGP